MAFVVRQEQQENESVYVLRDTEKGSFLSVWPAFGFNCIGAALRTGDQLVDFILPPPTLADLRWRPTGWGIPILFPWPGRIPSGRVKNNGSDHQLPDLDPQGYAIHG